MLCSKNIGVIAHTKADAIASYSNRNNITLLLAPGSSINSTYFDGSYTSLSGTSMATPHVAGAFAILRQFFKLQNSREPTPEEVLQILEEEDIFTPEQIAPVVMEHPRISPQLPEKDRVYDSYSHHIKRRKKIVVKRAHYKIGEIFRKKVQRNKKKKD